MGVETWATSGHNGVMGGRAALIHETNGVCCGGEREYCLEDF